MILGNRNVASGKKLLKTSKIFFPVDMEICFWFRSRYCYLQFLGVWFYSNFDFFSLVSDRWKEWKEYREENLRPRTVKSFRLWIRFGGKDRPGFVWKEMLDVKWSKARNCISKKQKNKDHKNDNENNFTIWNRLGWTKEKLPVSHNLDGSKQYNFTNCNVTL